MRNGIVDRIERGEAVLHASGYLFEMERRGYLQAGAFVPEVVLEHPDVVEQLTREFARGGADVLLAFTYYGHREKLRLIGKEDILEPMNRQAIAIAKKVRADFPNALVAGNICNTNVWNPNDPASFDEARAIFTEQIVWAKEEGVDFIVAETIAFEGEAKVAIEVCNAFDLPIVQGLAIHREGTLRDTDDSLGEVLKRLREHGADVVGFNCHRGPNTMLPLLQEAVTAIEPNRVCAWPVGYRTTAAEPTFGALTDTHECCPKGRRGELSFPVALDPFTVTRFEFAEFAVAAHAMGACYIGTCCGGAPHHMRAMAEALGRTPASSRFSHDMSKHYALGNNAMLKDQNRAYAGQAADGGSRL